MYPLDKTNTKAIKRLNPPGNLWVVFKYLLQSIFSNTKDRIAKTIRMENTANLTSENTAVEIIANTALALNQAD